MGFRVTATYSDLQARRGARRPKIHGLKRNPETGKRSTLCGRDLNMRTASHGERVQAVNCRACRVRISWTLGRAK